MKKIFGCGENTLKKKFTWKMYLDAEKILLSLSNKYFSLIKIQKIAFNDQINIKKYFLHT